MRGNFSNYFVYFISLVFSMVIYYTFVSLQYSEEIQKNILLSDTMNFMFLAASVVLMIFAAVFILYSNSFFIRQRKREVGLYSMLGLPKKTIGKLLFYENFILGIFALVIGIILGALLSIIFSKILVSLMGSGILIDFGISIKAVIQTVIVFMVFILFTSIQSYRLVYRFKLIELFQAEKMGEELPKVSIVSALSGIILLVVSYWLILRPFPEKLTIEYIQMNYGLALITLIIGSQFFFRSVTVYLLNLLKKNKTRYYRGTTLIETAQHLHRIKGNSRTFTIIALASAFTISLFGATYGGYYGNEQQSLEDAAFSYSHLSKSEQYDNEIETIIKNDKDHPIKAQLELPVIQMKGELSVELDYLTEPIKLIPESSFNEASNALDRETTVVLSENEAAVIKPRLTEFTVKDFKGQTLSLNIPNSDSTLIFTDMIEGSILPFDYPDFFVVISDEKFAEIGDQVTPLTYKLYEVEDEKTTSETAMKIDNLTGEDFQASSAYYIEYKEGKEGNALNLFILGFLGLVFLAATGCILYFKQLTEANEVKPNYEILSKIGLSKKEIHKSINKQMLFIFGLPLLVGIAHGSAILYFVSNFISNLIGANMLFPMTTAMAAFVLIYAIYYVLTTRTYNRIVNR